MGRWIPNAGASLFAFVLLRAMATILPAQLIDGGASAVFGQSFPAAGGYVNDHAGILDSATRERLEGLLTRIDQSLGVQVAVVALPSRMLEGRDPTDYANRLYEAWRIGDRESDRGLLILDVIGDRPGSSFIRVEVGYGLEGVLPDGRVGRILDEEVIPYLRDERRDLAYVAAVRALLRPVFAEGGRNPDEIDSLLARGGYQVRSPSREGVRRLSPLLLLALVILFSLLGGGRHRRRRGLLGPLFWGGFGGFGGGFGGSGGGGFGGFGGGLSGGGGAGRGY